jgi:hypothetical protein
VLEPRAQEAVRPRSALEVVDRRRSGAPDRELFETERSINGETPAECVAVRQERTKPLVDDLKVLMRQRDRLAPSHDLAKASRWVTFTRCLDDGRICLSNNAANEQSAALSRARETGPSPVGNDGASYCNTSDNLLINQADFGLDREMMDVEICAVEPPAGCPRVRYLSPEQATAHPDRDGTAGRTPSSITRCTLDRLTLTCAASSSVISPGSLRSPSR